MEPNETDAPGHPPVEPALVSRLPLIAMGAIVVLAILVALGIGLRGVEDYPEGSPEAALQAFLQAALDGDDDETIAALVPEAREQCRREIRLDGGAWSSPGTGFELDELAVDGETATGEVTMRSDDGDPFGGSSRRGTFRFELHDVDDEWLIAEADWPWWIERCLRVP